MIATHRIELPDYSLALGPVWHTTPASQLRAGLLGKASVELDEHLSAYPALRADHMTGG